MPRKTERERREEERDWKIVDAIRAAIHETACRSALSEREKSGDHIIWVQSTKRSIFRDAIVVKTRYPDPCFVRIECPGQPDWSWGITTKNADHFLESIDTADARGALKQQRWDKFKIPDRPKYHAGN